MSKIKDFYTKNLPPVEKQEMKVGGKQDAFGLEHDKFNKAMLGDEGAIVELTDKELTRKALEDSELWGGSKEEILHRAKIFFARDRADRDRRKAPHYEKVEKAIQEGAAELPETIKPTFQQENLIQLGKSWRLTEEQAKLALVKRGVIPKHMIPDFMQTTVGSLEDIKVPPTEIKDFNDAQDALRYEMMKGQHGAPPKYQPGEIRSFVGKAIDVPLTILNTGSRAAEGYAGGKLRAEREAGRKVDSTLVRTDSDWTMPPLSSVAKGVYAGLKGSAQAAFMQEGAPDYVNELYAKMEDYKHQAWRDVQIQYPPGTIDKTQATELAEKTFETLIKRDFNFFERLALKNPEATALITGIVADPINYVNVLSPILAGAKLARRAPGIRQVVDAGERVFKYGADMEQGLRGLGQTGADMASELRLVGDTARTARNDYLTAGANIDDLIKNYHARTDAEKAVLMDFLEGRTTKDQVLATTDVGNKFKKSITKQEPTKLESQRAEMRRLQDESGAGNIIKEVDGKDVITRAEDIENYVPHRKLIPDTIFEDRVKGVGFRNLQEAQELFAINPKSKVFQALDKETRQYLRATSGINDVSLGPSAERTRVAASSAEARTANMPAVKDPRLQFQLEALEGSKKVEAGTELRGIRETLKRYDVPEFEAAKKVGFVDKVKQTLAKGTRYEEQFPKSVDKVIKRHKVLQTFPMNNAADAEQAARDLTRLTKGETEFVVISEPELVRKFNQVTLPKGSKVSHQHLVLPKPVEERIRSLIAITDKPNPMDTSIKTFGDFHKDIIRPVQNFWRGNITILRSLQFVATNTAGAVGISVLANGFKAAAVAPAAARTAFRAAFAGVPDALKAPFTLADGKTKVPLGRLFDLMKKTGIIGQSQAKMALDLTSTGKTKVGKFLKSTLEDVPRGIISKTGLGKVASIGDDFQHASVFLANLRSLDPKDIAKAADITAEYAGNYSRLTKFEKDIMSNVFAFYSWNRFILPHLVKQIFKNPARLAAFEKLKRIAETYLGDNQPYFSIAIPDYIKSQQSFTSPKDLQPENEHMMAMTVMENPLNSLNFFAQESATGLLSPGALALTMALTGKDLEGRDLEDFHLPGPADFESLDTFKQWLYNTADSGPGRFVLNTSVPFGQATMDTVRLYSEAGRLDLATEERLRYAVGRYWLGIDRLGAKLFGAKPQSKGHVVPGLRAYVSDPMATGLTNKSDAIKRNLK